MEAERTAVISWGLSEMELLSYYVFSGKYLIKSGSLRMGQRPESAFQRLKRVFERYGVKKVVVESNADLSRLKDYSGGFGSSERLRWERKLRAVDIVMGMILEGKLGVSYEIKSLSGETMPACKLGRFIRLSEDGRAIFEMLNIRIPQRLLSFVADVYESVICQGVTVIRRIGEEGEARVRVGNVEIRVAPPVDGAKYVALWIRESNGSFEAIASFGPSRREAEMAHRKYVLSEMIKWVNENSAIGLVLGSARLPTEDVIRLAEKIREKAQTQALA